MHHNQQKKPLSTGNIFHRRKTGRIVQLPNGFLQTEYKSIDSDDWIDVTRRETIAGAEQAIDASIEHYAKKLEFTKGPKVVKTFE